MPALSIDFSTIAMAIAVLALVLALLSIGAHLKARNASSKWREQAEADWRRQLRVACRDAFAFVDLATVPPSAPLVTTKRITALRERVEQIDVRMQALRRGASNDRVAEAIEEMHHVAVSVAASLEAARAVRIEGVHTDGQGGWTRVAERVAEFDLATRELSVLLDTSGKSEPKA